MHIDVHISPQKRANPKTMLMHRLSRSHDFSPPRVGRPTLGTEKPWERGWMHRLHKPPTKEMLIYKQLRVRLTLIVEYHGIFEQAYL